MRRYLQQRKILRISTFLAVALGLSMGSSAIAQQQQTEEEPQQPQQQQQQQDDDDGFFGTDDDQDQRDDRADEDDLYDREQDERTDLPGDIESFNEFVNEHQRDGIDNVFEYTHEGTQEMASAMREIIPDDRDDLSTDLDTWENRIGALENEERGDIYPALVNQLFQEGADLLRQIQQDHYPGQEERVNQVEQFVENIDPNTAIQQQMDTVQNYFAHSAQAIQDMYVAGAEIPTEERMEPVTQHTFELSFAVAGETLAENHGDRHQQQEPQQQDQQQPQHGEQQQQQEDDDGFFDWGEDDQRAEVPGEVENFDDFVQDHREDGIDHVANYTRDGMSNFHDAMEALIPEDDEGMFEQIRDDKYGDEHHGQRGEEQHGQADQLREQLSQFEESVDELDDTVRAEYPARLQQTMTEGAQLLTQIQEQFYPQAQAQVEELYNIIEQFDENNAIEGQVNVIQNYFIQASQTTRTLGEMKERMDDDEQPVTMAHANMYAQAGGDYGDQPGQYDEPADEPGGFEDDGFEDDGLQDDDQFRDDDTLMEDDDQLREDDEIGGGPVMGQEIEQYTQFVEILSVEEINDEQRIVQGLRLLDNALASLVEEEPGMEEPGMQEPGMEEPGMQEPGQEQDQDLQGIQYGEPGMEHDDDHAMDDEHMMGEQDLQQKHQQFTQQVDQLERVVDDEQQFLTNLQQTLTTAGELFTALQQEGEHEIDEQQVQLLTNIAEEIDTTQSLDEQAAHILSFFTLSSEVLEGLDRDEEAPVTLK